MYMSEVFKSKILASKLQKIMILCWFETMSILMKLPVLIDCFCLQLRFSIHSTVVHTL